MKKIVARTEASSQVQRCIDILLLGCLWQSLIEKLVASMSKKDKLSGASPRDDNGTEKKNVQSGPWDI